MVDIGDVRERLRTAVSALATGTGPIKDRLWSGYMCVNALKASDLDDEQQAEVWRRMMTKLTVVKDGDPRNGQVKNSIMAMHPDDAAAIAQIMVGLHLWAEHECWRRQR